MAKNGSVGKKNNRSSGKKGKKKETTTRQVKAFVANRGHGVKEEERAIVLLEESINKWMSVTGYVYELEIHSTQTVSMMYSLVMFVDYSITTNDKTEKRLEEVLGAEGYKRAKEFRSKTDSGETTEDTDGDDNSEEEGVASVNEEPGRDDYSGLA